MLDFQSSAAIVFLLIFFLFFLHNRNKFHRQNILFPFPLIYFAMYKTKLGLESMDSFAKRFPRLLHWVGTVGVVTGFIGMVFIAFTLIQNIYTLLTTPTAAAGVALVLPFNVRGAFFVPFFYWIISIFILAVVHEFSHGVFARLFKIRIKSSGFAFLAVLVPVLPAAFVEPNEKQLVKKPKKQQLSVFAAGPFANIVLAAVVLLLSLAIATPLNNYVIEEKGVEVTGFIEDSLPAKQAGMQENEIITEVANRQVLTVAEFTDVMGGRQPGDHVWITTDKGDYVVNLTAHPENESAAYLGIYVQQKTGIQEDFSRKYGSWTAHTFVWFAGLLFWLFVLNLGIGLFNLLPLGPIDGGRMLRTALHHYIGEKKGDVVWKYVSVTFLVLLLVNLGFAFVR